MTLIELILLIACFGVVLAVASLLDALPGAFSAIGFATFLGGIFFGLWLLKKRALPLCKNGTCGVKDFTGIPVQRTDHGAKFKCRCGDVYRLEGNRFFLIGEDGCETLFKVRERTGGTWHAPSEAPSSIANQQEKVHGTRPRH